jgi:predicted DNA-binding transcriptional regulator YafY
MDKIKKGLKYKRELKEIKRILKKAYKEKRKIKMHYYSLSSDESRWRKVSIYQMGKNYIIAYCYLRDGERTFIIDRINAAAILGEKYAIPENWTPESIVSEK